MATDSGIARLEDECRDAIDRKMLISPIFGWGWSDDQPSDFHGVIKELVADPEGNLRGGYAIIGEPGHKYDGHFCTFTLHHKGVWNFRTRLADYVVCIYKALPERLSEIVINYRPSLLPRGYSTCGYAVIGPPKADQEA